MKFFAPAFWCNFEYKVVLYYFDRTVRSKEFSPDLICVATNFNIRIADLVYVSPLDTKFADFENVSYSANSVPWEL